MTITMTEEQWTRRSVEIATMRMEFGAVLHAVDRYLELNPVDSKQVFSVHGNRMPIHGRSVASAVAAAAQYATSDLHEMGYRVVNAQECYEVLAGQRRIYEYNSLMMQRNVYENTAKDVVTKAIAELNAAYPAKEFSL